MTRAHSRATSNVRCGATNRTTVAGPTVNTKVITKKNTLNSAERIKIIRRGRRDCSGGSRAGSTAVRPAAWQGYLIYSSTISRNGAAARSGRSAGRTGIG